jgi:CheY-like chemotaxis protein
LAPLAPEPRKHTVLIVEDEMLIAMDVIDLLESGGYDILGPVPSVAAALALLRTQRPDACVLDVNLRGEHSAPVAALLKSQKVPFVLSSAYGPDTLDQYEAFHGITNVGKPAPARLSALIGSLLKTENP